MRSFHVSGWKKFLPNTSGHRNWFGLGNYSNLLYNSETEADFYIYLVWFGEEGEINYKEKTTFAISHLSTVVRFTFLDFT